MWIKRWCIIRITKCFSKNNSVQINHSPVYAYLFFFPSFVEHINLKSRRNRRFKSKRSKDPFLSDSPQSLFTVNRMFSRWPMTTIYPLRFLLSVVWDEVARLLGDEKSPFMDRFKASRNVKCRFSPPFNAATSTVEVNLKEEFGSWLLGNHRKFTQFLLPRGIKSFSIIYDQSETNFL